MNRFFTKLPLLGAVLLSLSVPAKAQFFDHLGANVQVGTNGISIYCCPIKLFEARKD